MQKIEYLRIDQLHPHPANPRKDLGDLTELTDAIKAKGILQNLTVVPYWSPVHKRIMEGLYTVIIGHRRMAAAKLAGLTEVPCVIADMTDKEQIETMMVENVQRSDLTVYEQAEGFQLMLDMGSTVDQVAQKVGLSATTVRNRAKLTKLDKKKFKQAEARGGTMTDFMKLHDIKDEARRNHVLEAIGTADFNQRYQAAIRKEKDAEWLRETIDAFRAADWCDEITAEQRDELVKAKKIDYQGNHGTWNKKPVQKPQDADKLLYFFYVATNEVDLYREIRKTKEPEIDPKEQARRDAAEEIGDLLAVCETREQDFRTLREDFIMEFDAFNTYREEIMQFAVKALLYRDKGSNWNSLIDKEELAGLLDVEYDEKKKELVWDDLRHRLRVPEYVLLRMAYLLLEDGNRGWTIKCYDNTVRCNLPKHRKDPQLDLLYECLKSLGYALSTEEQRACEGMVSEYQEAKRICDQYNEVWNKKEGAAE